MAGISSLEGRPVPLKKKKKKKRPCKCFMTLAPRGVKTKPIMPPPWQTPLEGMGKPSVPKYCAVLRKIQPGTAPSPDEGI